MCPNAFVPNIPKINTFPDDDRLWRVDWFGAVHPNANKQIEPDIQVLLSPLTRTAKDLAASDAVDSKKQVTASIGVGLLPHVFIGSIWQKQRQLYLQASAYKAQTFSFDLSAQTVHIRSITDKIDNRPLVLPEQHYVFDASAATRCLTIDNLRTRDKLIIPQIELMRFYYFDSTELAKDMFLGSWRNSSPLFALNTGVADHDPDAEFDFEVPGPYGEEDGKILARLAGSRLARRNASMIHESLMKQMANHKHLQPEHLHPVTYPPFIGKTLITAHGKWLRYGERTTRFLVFWLDQCTGRFPFSAVNLSGDNIKELNNVDESNATSSKDGQLAYRHNYRKKNVGKDSRVNADKDAQKNAAKVNVYLRRDRFADLKDKVKLMRKQIRSVNSRKKQQADSEEISNFSTDTSSMGEHPSGYISISSDADKPSVHRFEPVTLHQLYAGLVRLREDLKGEFDFELITATGPEDVFNDDKIGMLQYVPMPTGVKLIWAYCYPRKKERRRIMIVEVSYKNKNLYFLEAERRMQIKKRDIQAERMTVLLVYGLDFKKITKEALADVIQCCAVKGYMGLKNQELPGLGRMQIQHRWEKNKPEEIAKALKKKMKKAIKGKN